MRADVVAEQERYSDGGVVGQALANAVLGLVVFKLAESLPGAVDRRNAGAGFRR